MRRTRGWTGLRASVVALGLVAAAAGVTRADSMTSTLMAYETSGLIGPKGITGDASAITYMPLIGASMVESPSSLALGAFQTKALADGETVTYDNTPFAIKFKVDNINNGTSAVTPNETPFDITGVLNGTLKGGNQSNVTATFDAPAHSLASDPTAYSFATGLYTNTLKISGNPVSIVPASTFNGLTTAQGTLSTSFTATAPVPEPSTVMLFAATIVGLGLRHRLRRAGTELE